jgi:hypothetical protein
MLSRRELSKPAQLIAEKSLPVMEGFKLFWGCLSFFAGAYSSWQRGSNENSNMKWRT